MSKQAQPPKRYEIIFECVNCEAKETTETTAKEFHKTIYDFDLDHEKDCPDHRVFIKSNEIESKTETELEKIKK